MLGTMKAVTAPVTVSDMQEPMIFDAACAIGENLCATAFWNDKRTECNWIGRRVEDPVAAAKTISSGAIGAGVYDGGAGIALFLAELATRTGQERFKCTAEAALRRSWKYIRDRNDVSRSLSFFGGGLGVGCVAARFENLGLEGIPDTSIEELTGLLSIAVGAPHPLDVIGGNAGAIPALLRLALLPRYAGCLGIARRLGDELCSNAQWDGSACSWNALDSGGPGFTFPPLGGFSHGASGIAAALLRLYARTFEERYLRTARGAFRFEDTLFNPEKKNWIDARSPFTVEGGAPTGVFGGSWCHGAPGIGLARLIAMQVDRDERDYHRMRAAVACETTLALLNQSLRLLKSDPTPCHGVTGLTDILLAHALTNSDNNLLELIRLGLKQLVASVPAPQDWPSGLPGGGPNPSLMVGTAGVGYMLLRFLHPADIPSPLVMFTPFLNRRLGVP